MARKLSPVNLPALALSAILVTALLTPRAVAEQPTKRPASSGKSTIVIRIPPSAPPTTPTVQRSTPPATTGSTTTELKFQHPTAHTNSASTASPGQVASPGLSLSKSATGRTTNTHDNPLPPNTITRLQNPFAPNQPHPNGSTLLSGPLSRWQITPSMLDAPTTKNTPVQIAAREPAPFNTSLAAPQPSVQTTSAAGPSPNVSVAQFVEQSPPPRHEPRTFPQPESPPTPLNQPEAVLPAVPPHISQAATPQASQPSALAVKDAFLTIGVPDTKNAGWLEPSSSDNSLHRSVASALNDPNVVPASALDAPDPTHYTKEPTRDPAWMGAAAKNPSDSFIDPAAFEQPPHALPIRSQTIAATPAVESTEAEPVVVSDINEVPDDSPQAMLASAQNIAHEAKESGDLSRVLELCQRIANENAPPEIDNPARQLASWVHNRQGEQFADAGQNDAAFGEFQTAITLDPENALAIHNRAVTLAQQNNYDAALLDFNRVIQLNPGLAIAYRNRAELLAAQGKTDAALSDYDHAIEQLPNDAELYRSRARALQQLGQVERAVADIDRAIQFAPAVAEGFTQRGNLLAERGEYSRAVDDFNKAMKLNPDLAEPRRSLAWLEATCPDDRYRDTAGALRDAETASKLSSPDDYLALDVLATALANNNEFDKAIAAELQAIRCAPPESVEPLQSRLRFYQQRQPYRTGR